MSQYFFEYKDAFTNKLYQCIAELTSGYLTEIHVFDGDKEMTSEMLILDALNYFELNEQDKAMGHI